MTYPPLVEDVSRGSRHFLQHPEKESARTSALEQAAAEAQEVGYVWMELLALRDMLGVRGASRAQPRLRGRAQIRNGVRPRREERAVHSEHSELAAGGPALRVTQRELHQSSAARLDHLGRRGNRHAQCIGGGARPELQRVPSEHRPRWVEQE